MPYLPFMNLDAHVFLNDSSGSQNRGFWHDSVVNPWDDDFLSTLQHIGFAFYREYRLRDREMQSYYWRKFGEETELLAEAQESAYYAMWRLMNDLEDEYIREYMLDSELEEPIDPEKLGAKIANSHAIAIHMAAEIAEHEAKPDGMVMYEADSIDIMGRVAQSNSLMPLIDKHSPKFNASILERESIYSLPTWFTEEQAPFYSFWRENLSLLQHEIDMSYRAFINSKPALIPKNTITKKAGEKRLLLTNKDIPLVDDSTFLFWYSICGGHSFWLDQHYAARLEDLCGFRPLILFSFITPHLPMSHEHRDGTRGIQSEDATTSHSLPRQSTAHRILESGRLDLGRVTLNVVATDGKKDKIVSSYNVQDTTQVWNAHRPFELLPLPSRKDYIPLFGGTGGSGQLAELIRIPVSDPYTVSPYPMEFPSHHIDRQMDLGLRALAKSLHTYFRFDQNAEGNLSAIEWAESYIVHLKRFALASSTTLARRRLRTAKWITNPPRAIRMAGKRFNIDDIG